MIWIHAPTQKIINVHDISQKKLTVCGKIGGAARYFAILRMGDKLHCGLKKRIRKRKNQIHLWLCSCLQGLIQNGFMIIFMGKLKFDLSEDALNLVKLKEMHRFHP